jgi:hypothetical protein
MDPLVACADGEPLSRFLIHNHVLARPELRESFDEHLRGFEAFCSLDEMKAPVATRLEDGKRPLHSATPIGPTGDSRRVLHHWMINLSSSSLSLRPRLLGDQTFDASNEVPSFDLGNYGADACLPRSAFDPFNLQDREEN